MTCSCEAITELWDDEAKAYANGHLRKVAVLGSGWTTLWECPDSGLQWVKEYPRSEEHGGGPVRLRRATKEDLDND